MRQRRHHLTLGLVALAIGVLILPACKKDEAVKALPPPDVLVHDAATRDVPVYREWVGTLDGSENAEIRARVTGYLLKRDYQEGALVKKDDVLFEIDPRPLRQRSRRRRASSVRRKAVQIASQAEAERGHGTLRQEGDFRAGVYEQDAAQRIERREGRGAQGKCRAGAVEPELLQGHLAGRRHRRYLRGRR